VVELGEDVSSIHPDMIVTARPPGQVPGGLFHVD
jgi:hypothetical protein